MAMTAARAVAALSAELMAQQAGGGEPLLHELYVLMDDLRREWSAEAVAYLDDGRHERRAVAVVAATIDALADEGGHERPAWVDAVALDLPYFLWPADTMPTRLLVMLQTHPAFTLRNVFVPRSILSRV